MFVVGHGHETDGAGGVGLQGGEIERIKKIYLRVVSQRAKKYRRIPQDLSKYQF